MKKTFLVIALVVLALAALGVGAAFAQGSQPPTQNGYGGMHDYVEQALAVKLGLTEEKVEELLASGKTMYDIALDKGIKQEDLASFMNEVHSSAFAAAVKDGVMTQEQADWMLQRMQGRGLGTGNCPMHNGQAGYGRGTGAGMQNRGAGYGHGMMWNSNIQNP